MVCSMKVNGDATRSMARAYSSLVTARELCTKAIGRGGRCTVMAPTTTPPTVPLSTLLLVRPRPPTPPTTREMPGVESTRATSRRMLVMASERTPCPMDRSMKATGETIRPTVEVPSVGSMAQPTPAFGTRERDTVKVSSMRPMVSATTGCGAKIPWKVKVSRHIPRGRSTKVRGSAASEKGEEPLFLPTELCTRVDSVTT
mmetsp:Transcript_29186/g.68354  ORF Transcript_29186/g.68354 Transcript_29186/m.68354 type:complete len:201 (+) Transcript_29186:585-1187(+)